MKSFNIKHVLLSLTDRRNKEDDYIFVDDHPVDVRRPKYKKWRELLKKKALKCKCCGAKAIRFKLVKCESRGKTHIATGKIKYTFFLIDQYGSRMTFDHWIPKSFLKKRKLESKDDNFVLMCKLCNQLKGNMVPFNWKEEYKKMK